MRDYGVVRPEFWTRGTGRQLRGNTDAQLIALYLCTCPNATAVGIYYLPLVTLAHETGLSEKRVLAALATCERVGFAHYDVAAELVWVPRMAHHQFGDTIDPKDKRRGGLLRAGTAKLVDHRFTRQFWARYGGAYHLGNYPFGPPETLTAIESDWTGLQSTSKHQEQEQDQEQEQEQDTTGAQAPTLPGLLPPERGPAKRRESPYGMREDWEPTPEHARDVRAKGLHLGRVVEDFRAYWRGQSKVRRTSKNWNVTFAKNLQRILATDWLLDRMRLTESEKTRASWPDLDPAHGAHSGEEPTEAEADEALERALADLSEHTRPLRSAGDDAEVA